MVTGGTENHLLLWDLKADGLSGGKMEKVCEEASIIVQLAFDLLFACFLPAFHGLFLYKCGCFSEAIARF